MRILAIILCCLLLPAGAALAESRVESQLVAGLDEAGQPIAELDGKGLHISWDGSLGAPAEQGVSRHYISTDLGPDITDITAQLRLDTDSWTRLYVTPSNSQPDQPRLVAVTQLDGRTFRCRVFQREGLVLITELDLGPVYTQRYGEFPDNMGEVELAVVSVAQLASHDLVVMLRSSYQGQVHSDLFITNGFDWTQLALPAGFGEAGSLEGYWQFTDPFMYDRIYIGPADEIMYCESGRAVHFLARGSDGNYAETAAVRLPDVAARLGIKLDGLDGASGNSPSGHSAGASSAGPSALPWILGGLVLLLVVIFGLFARRSRQD